MANENFFAEMYKDSSGWYVVFGYWGIHKDIRVTTKYRKKFSTEEDAESALSIIKIIKETEKW